MRIISLGVPALASIIALAGCQVQHTTVLEATATNAGGGSPYAVPVRQPVPQHSPCAAPAASGPYERLSNLIYNPRVEMPARATAEHVNGCAGVRFRIGPDGVPRDLTLLTEYPLGYGFGQKALEKVSAMRWAPRDDLSWHFAVVNQFQPSSG